MEINILDTAFDEVINSAYITAKTDYAFALKNLVPLIDRLDLQRKTLPQQFYSKLEKDILNGCVMPPLTIAFVLESRPSMSKGEFGEFINENIKDAFVLDGIQRLNTLDRVKLKEEKKLNLSRPIYLNIIISDSMDKLLYRMITLNNGQKPMSARHQVEILADNIYDFNSLNIEISSERTNKKKIKGIFKKSAIIKAYLAFISNSINIDNQKIISSKLDELITDQIIESDLSERDIQFSDVIDMINRLIESPELSKWFTMENNLIGFCSGITKQFQLIDSLPKETVLENINKLEDAFKYINVSKIKLGLARRKVVQYLIINFDEVLNMTLNQLTDKISQEI